MANATPAILPLPTVPETAVVRAWKCETSPSFELDPSFSISSYFPRTTLIDVIKYLMLGKPKYNVKKMALPTKRYITNGFSPIEKKTTWLKKSETGWNASSILWSNPFSCEKTGNVKRLKKLRRNIFFINDCLIKWS